VICRIDQCLDQWLGDRYFLLTISALGAGQACCHSHSATMWCYMLTGAKVSACRAKTPPKHAARGCIVNINPSKTSTTHSHASHVKQSTSNVIVTSSGFAAIITFATLTSIPTERSARGLRHLDHNMLRTFSNSLYNLLNEQSYCEHATMIAFYIRLQH